MSKVYLTGAGPGDIELLTIKALRVIQSADVIIYDKLANPEMLKEAKSGTLFIYVGKADKHHIMPQEQINETIYRCALEYENVVRLKGGDPFVFGRGGEEALYLQERGVAFEIIPGISSAISVPAYAGIPVTHRGVAVSFRVITAHETPDKKTPQLLWEEIKSDETLVFLMGMHNLEKITQNLLKVGKPKNYPIAVISKGTTPQQQVVVGTLQNISKKAKDLPTPATIVVGKVVHLRKKLEWFHGA
jgi:uroporphyrin-III C-methyltransferase